MDHLKLVMEFEVFDLALLKLVLTAVGEFVRQFLTKSLEESSTVSGFKNKSCQSSNKTEWYLFL